MLVVKMATSLDDELKCGICLELFQDPRSLPCLHTFCSECIQRSLNEENHSLKCPVCRAKHELKEEGAMLLPLNEYALQELPLRRLQQQQREGIGGQAECKSCEGKAPLVAWCKDCDAGMICQPCVVLHKKIVSLREHRLMEGDKIESTSEKRVMASVCLKHTGQELKYHCTPCSELVCPECLLFDHRVHQFSTVKETRHSLETKMKELVSVVVTKKEEFCDYLEKANEAEVKALEYSELMKSEVNNVFDGIIASVEAQRNEALQSVSQGAKEIWSQKEMIEVSLAQLDSFNRFADAAHKCTTDASYVAMATQCIKLMGRLEDIHGDKSAFNHKLIPLGSQCRKGILHVPLDKVFALNQPLSLQFSPASGSDIVHVDGCIKVVVSLMIGDFPMYHPILHGNYKLFVTARINDGFDDYSGSPEVKLIQSSELSWEVTDSYQYGEYALDVSCRSMSEDQNAEIIATGSATYNSIYLHYD